MYNLWGQIVGETPEIVIGIYLTYFSHRVHDKYRKYLQESHASNHYFTIIFILFFYFTLFY